MSEEVVTFGSFRADLRDERLWRDGEVVPLPPRVFALLRCLLERRGQLVAKAEIFRAVWPDAIVGDAVLTVAMGELRKALGDDPRTPQFIETAHRRGYRFLVHITSGDQGSFATASGSPLPATPSPPSSVDVVGRAAEVTQLHAALDRVLRGQRQLVFVTGEPGIGKTTVVDAFLEESAARGPLWLGRGQCIEHYGTGEAYLPVLDALGQLHRQPGGERLVGLWRRYAPTWLMQLPALVDDAEVEALQRKTQGATRERMLREMAEALEAFTAERPLVFVLEDLHWSDYSTLDLLAFLARRRPPCRLLVLGTYRPVDAIVREHPVSRVKQELQVHGLCTELSVAGLSRAAVEEYLTRRFSQSTLPTLLAPRLQQRTNGNPLFIGNIVQDWLTQEVIRRQGDDWVLQGDIVTVTETIPQSLRQMIEQQLLRLSPQDQRILEAASTVGTEFTGAAVAAAIEDVSEETIDEHCERFVHWEYVVQARKMVEWPDGTVTSCYGFVHALYQEVLYERVRGGRRRQWHQRIGERLEVAYGAQAFEIAAELAMHFEQGRDYRRAFHYLESAGKNAIQRNAYQEAISHLTKGLELLITLPLTQERLQKELALQITLGYSLQEIKGSAALEVEQAYTRALALCQQMKDTAALFLVLRGLCAVYQERGDFHTAYTLADQLLSLTESSQVPDQQLWAHHALGSILYSLGEFVPAQRHLEKALTLYDTQLHRFDDVGQSPGGSCLYQLATLLWLLGYPTQALEHAHQALTLARELSHPYSISMALSATAGIHRFRREQQSARALEAERDTLAKEQGFATWLTMGTFWQGWTLIEQGQGDEGIRHMQQGLTALHARGAELPRPGWLGLLAEAYGMAGQAAKGLQVLNEALNIIDRGGRRVYEAELYRLKGELILQQARQKEPETRDLKRGTDFPSPQVSRLKPFVSSKVEREAEEHFLKAIDIAQKQQAKSWELRAATSLARLWRQQGKKKQAHKMLSAIYHWFTEGFDTRDLQEAQTLIEELRR